MTFPQLCVISRISRIFRYSLCTSAALSCISYAAQAAPPTKVLFIGNSITYFNNMPQFFKQIADEKGDTVALTVYAPGGTGFQNHYMDNNVFDRFREGNWDVIILQPGSNESVGVPPTQSRALTLQQGRKLIDSALKYNPCARIMFYEISYGIYGTNPADVTTYNTFMDHIRTTAGYLSDSTGLSFAPAGEAMRFVWNQDPATLLWGSAGDIHPNIKGSYIISCVFYASVFHKPSAGTSILNGNTAANAAYYQKVADSVVLQHLSNWRIDTTWHKAAFSFVSGQGGLIQFQSQAGDADSLRWFFGPQQTSTVTHPSFTFTQAGVYPVKLVAYFGSCTDTVIRNITIGSVSGIRSIGQLEANIYPNPVSETLYLQLPEKAKHFKVTLRDCIGRVRLVQNDRHTIDVSGLSKGLYYIRIEDTVLPQQYTGKIIKR